MHGEGVTGFQAGCVGTGAWVCDDGLAGRPRSWSGQAASPMTMDLLERAIALRSARRGGRVTVAATAAAQSRQGKRERAREQQRRHGRGRDDRAR
jgi:hypothetical protein